MAAPIINSYHGSQVTTTSEADLFELQTTKYYETHINLKNMLSGDTFVFYVKIWDEELGEYFAIDKITKSNAQDPAGFTLDFKAGTRYKVTVQKTAGTNRTITWLRMEV